MEIDVDAAVSALDKLIRARESDTRKPEVSAIRQRRPIHQQTEDKAKKPDPDTATKPIDTHIYTRTTTRNHPDTVISRESTSRFLEKTRFMQIIGCKPFEGTGTGAATVFLNKPSPKGHTRYRAALPFKPWMTKTSICEEPYIIFQFAPAAIEKPQNSLEFFALTEEDYTQPLPEVVTITVIMRDSQSMPHSKKLSVNGPLEISLMTAPDADSKYTLVHQATTEHDTEALHLTFPSWVMSAFVKLSIRPLIPSVALIKIVGICVSAGKPNGAKEAPTTKQSVVEEPKKNLLWDFPTPVAGSNTAYMQEKIPRSSHTPAINPSPALSSESFGEPRTTEDGQTRYRKKNHGAQALLGDHSVEDAKYSQTSSFGKAKDPNRRTPGTLLEAAEAKGKARKPVRRIYNWLKDETNTVSSRSDSASVISSLVEDPHSYPDDARKMEDELYIGLRETWTVLPTWTVTDALQYCMQRATSFSYTCAPSDDASGIVSALSSTFTFNLLQLIVTNGNSLERLNEKVAVQVVSRIMVFCTALGYSMELLGRTTDGFCFASTSTHVPHDEVSASKKYCLVVCSPSAKEHEALTQGARLAAAESYPPLAKLRAVLDLTGTLSNILLPIEFWTRGGGVRYYGPEGQSQLSRFLGRSCCGRKSQKSQEASCDAGQRVIFSGFLITAKRIPVEGNNCSSEPFLSLTMHHNTPQFLVWQPQQKSPRVVLTDQHLFEHLDRVDGALVPQDLLLLANILFKREDGDVLNAVHSKLLVTSEDPWKDLVEKNLTDMLHNGLMETWMEARRKATTKFAFHSLSTAFKRGWRNVGICLPWTCSTASSIPLSLSSGLLDQDALMNTILQWSYPQPSSVVFFYGHDQSCETSASASAFHPFTSDALSCFVAAENIYTALE